MKIEPIGSVIKLSEYLFFVAGYQPVENAGRVGLDYILLPYPLGFMHPEDYSICPVDGVGEVLSEGYLDNLGEKYLEDLEMFVEKCEEVNYQEFVQFLTRMGETLQGQQEERE